MEWGVITCADAGSRGAATGVGGASVCHVLPHPSVGGGK